MATHFSANQYENAFAANRLQNYEIPSKYKKHPTPKVGCTQIISNDRGHLLGDVPRSKESPWGNFKGTWDDDLDFCKGKTRLDQKITLNNTSRPSSEKNTERKESERPASHLTNPKEVTFAKEKEVISE